MLRNLTPVRYSKGKLNRIVPENDKIRAVVDYAQDGVIY